MPEQSYMTSYEGYKPGLQKEEPGTGFWGHEFHVLEQKVFPPVKGQGYAVIETASGEPEAQALAIAETKAEQETDSLLNRIDEGLDDMIDTRAEQREDTLTVYKRPTEGGSKPSKRQKTEIGLAPEESDITWKRVKKAGGAKYQKARGPVRY